VVNWSRLRRMNHSMCFATIVVHMSTQSVPEQQIPMKASRMLLKWSRSSAKSTPSSNSKYQNLTLSVRTAKWVGDVFIYTTANRLQYLVGEQTYTITHIDPGYFLLGYIARDGRVYLADKDVNVVSYALSLSVVEYQTVVLRGDMDAAEEILVTIPTDQMPKIARFLEGQGTSEIRWSKV